MIQNLNKIRNLYNSVSKAYTDAFSGELEKKPKDQELLNRFAQDIGNRSPVWDLGCGPGQTTNYLKNLGIEISGLDLSEQILEQARINYSDIHFQEGDILDLKFKNSSVFAILAFYAFVHFTKDQINIAFHEIYRVLKPGGALLFTFHVGEETIHLDEFLGKQIDIDFMFFTCDFIIACLNTCGFKNIDVIEREPYPGIEYQSRRAYVSANKSVD